MKGEGRRLFAEGVLDPSRPLPSIWHISFMKSFADAFSAEATECSLAPVDFDFQAFSDYCDMQ